MDKVRFVKQLGELLKVADSTLSDVYLKDENLVCICKEDGSARLVNIAGDSDLAIVVDVAQCVLWE